MFSKKRRGGYYAKWYLEMRELTVKELIEKLQVLPQEATILVDGYETGFDAVVNAQIINIEKNVKAQCYDGIYEQSDLRDAKSVYLISTRNKRE